MFRKPKILFTITFLLGLMFWAFYACQKDFSEANSAAHQQSNTFTVEEAKRFFESKKQVIARDGSEEFLTSLSVQPSWLDARRVNYMGQPDLIIAPVFDSLNSPNIPGQFYRLAFYKDSTQHISCRLLFFFPDSAYAQAHQNINHVEDFTGLTCQINEVGDVGYVGYLRNGAFEYITGLVGSDSLSTGSSDRDWPPSWWPGGGPHCPSPNGHGPSRWKRLTDWFDNVFGQLGHFFDGLDDSGSGPLPETPPNIIGLLPINSNFHWPGFFTVTGGSGGGGGTGVNLLLTYFSNDIFFNGDFTLPNSECMDTYGPDDMPLIFATSAYTPGNWGGYFIGAFNKYVQERTNGNHTITFGQILANPNSFYPVTSDDPALVNALLPVYENMLNSYETCMQSINAGNASNELPGNHQHHILELEPEQCACFGNYSVDDALNEFIAGYVNHKLDFLPVPQRLWLLAHPEGVLPFYQFLKDKGDNPGTREFVTNLVQLLLEQGYTFMPYDRINFIYVNLPSINVPVSPPDQYATIN